MKWYDPQPEFSSEPLSAHEKLRAHALIARIEEVLLTAPKNWRTKEGRRLPGFMRWWLENPTPFACEQIRETLANPPKFLGEAA